MEGGLAGRWAAFDAATRRVPTSVVSRIWDETTRGTSVALCLHRVGMKVRPTDPLPELTVSPGVLDDFLGLVTEGRDPAATTPLTLGFDDGYADAVEYVEDRAPGWPSVEWVLFVCPEKLEKQAGFRWDLMETLHPPDRARLLMRSYLDTGLDLLRENERADLRGLYVREEFRMAAIPELLRVRRHPNVSLGNHSDHHFRFTRLGSEAARAELEQSRLRFEALFGPTRHFAFPFGVPGIDFAPVDVWRARESGHVAIWSTEPRTYRPDERMAGVILPRIPVIGGLGPKAIALLIARMALRRRMGDAAWATGRLLSRLGARSALVRQLLGL